MKYRGRNLDPIRLWEQYVEIPQEEISGEFLGLTFCPNPDHQNDRSPAFQINLERPLVHCFSRCGISGNYARAISIIEGISVKDAERKIRECLRQNGNGEVRHKRTVILEPQRRSYEYKRYLSPPALAYMVERGITAESISKWALGFDPESQRIVIPAYDERGRLAFCIRRAINPGDMPKYLYDEGADLRGLLFGLDKTDLGMIRSAGMVLVEGSLDVIRLHQHGVVNAVGILGASVSTRQARLISSLRPRRVFLMFDRDLAGANAILQARLMLKKTPLSVCRYPAGKYDPAELTRKEAYRSIERARSIVNFKRQANNVKIGVEIG